MFEQFVKAQISARKNSGLLRQTQQVNQLDGRQVEVGGKVYLNFASNDYLGLAADAQNDHVSLAQKFAVHNVSSGATASPLVTGLADIHQDLQQQILFLVNAPKGHGCLLLSSGFAANSAVIRALFNVTDSNALLFQDRLNHASLLDSGAASQGQGFCRQYRFKHNDHLDLERKLQQKCDTQTRFLAVTEGVFSMDGDSPDLAQFSSTCKKYGGWLMVDDAHGIGVNGEVGGGTIAAQNLPLDSVDILVTTFGKAVGAQGAAIIAPQYLIDYFVNFSKEYIYSTHLSPVQAAWVSHNLEKLQNQSWRRDKLQQNIRQFKTLLNQHGFADTLSHSAIQPIIVGDEQRAVTLAERLKAQGIWLSAIRYPTVPKGEARLRVTLTSAHKTEDIDLLFKILVELGYEQ